MAWLDQGDAKKPKGRFLKNPFQLFWGLLGGGFTYFFFSQTLGEGFQFDYIIFFRGVVQPPSRLDNIVGQTYLKLLFHSLLAVCSGRMTARWISWIDWIARGEVNNRAPSDDTKYGHVMVGKQLELQGKGHAGRTIRCGYSDSIETQIPTLNWKLKNE